MLTQEDELNGLPKSIREAAALRAKEKGKIGWLFNLSAPSYIPFMRYIASRKLRENMYRAYMSIGNKDDKYDNKEISAFAPKRTIHIVESDNMRDTS